MKEKGGKKYCLPFFGCNLGALTFMKKREHQEKGELNRRLRLLCTFCIGVSRKLRLHFTVMFYVRCY